ncbi:o-succinylbenzoate synthase [Serratia sp. Leaf50]|nr:o-succinylbenzoate synthase [Serratia sp. Leaf50]
MRRAKVYRYSLPMDAGVVLRNQRLNTREGLLVQLWHNHRSGWGEIAPLPGFSPESLEQAQLALLPLLDRWQRGEAFPDCVLPSVDFGVSCALAEIDGSLPAAFDTRRAVMCHGDPDELLFQLNALADGKLGKVKVGLYEAVGDGLNVSSMLEAIPDLKLRLDANRSWSPDRAAAFARYLCAEQRRRICFIEEPCHTPQQSLEFADATGIAIAWDESLREAGFMLQRQSGVAAIIVKPTLTGSIDVCRRQIAEAQSLGIQVVISSSLESSLGLSQLARLSRWLLPDSTPGLDTLHLMQAQLMRPWPGSTLPLITADALEVIWQQ